MFQTEPMFLEFEKFFVSPEHLGGTLFAGDRKLVFSMRQDFLKMSRSRHSFENSRLQAPISREISISNHQNSKRRFLNFGYWSFFGAWVLGFGDFLQFDRVTLEFVVERWPLNTEQLGCFLFVSVALRQCLQNRDSLHIVETLHTLRDNAAFNLLQCRRQLQFSRQFFYS